jgi:hypothetical protein
MLTLLALTVQDVSNPENETGTQVVSVKNETETQIVSRLRQSRCVAVSPPFA